jgi:hypothetical protein
MTHKEKDLSGGKHFNGLLKTSDQRVLHDAAFLFVDIANTGCLRTNIKSCRTASYESAKIIQVSDKKYLKYS